MIAALSSASTTPAEAQAQYSSAAFRSGEHLTYRVKWGFLRLGTVQVRQELADPEFSDYMSVWINGESATGLPFIDVFFRSVSILNINDPTNILYELFADREDRERVAYIYDPPNGRCFALGMSGADVGRLDTLEAPVPYYDGVGLFMVTRCLAGSDTTVLLPTVMDYAMGFTSIRFSGAVDAVSVAAFDEDIPAHEYLGHTEWVGSAFGGMSGDFQGWVAADSTRLLLKANVGIFLGSVTIELEDVGGPE